MQIQKFGCNLETETINPTGAHYLQALTLAASHGVSLPHSSVTIETVDGQRMVLVTGINPLAPAPEPAEAEVDGLQPEIDELSDEFEAAE